MLFLVASRTNILSALHFGVRRVNLSDRGPTDLQTSSHAICLLFYHAKPMALALVSLCAATYSTLYLILVRNQHSSLLSSFPIFLMTFDLVLWTSPVKDWLDKCIKSSKHRKLGCISRLISIRVIHLIALLLPRYSVFSLLSSQIFGCLLVRYPGLIIISSFNGIV